MRRPSLRERLAGRRARAEVEAELRFHIEERVDELVAEGWEEERARREVMRRFGDLGEVEAACRRQRAPRAGAVWTALVEGGARDVRLALRAMTRSPGFALAVAATLGLGIGATAGVFAVVDAVLLRPLPHPDPERLVLVRQQNSPDNRWPLSAVDYLGILERQEAFSSVGAVRRGEAALGGERPAWVATGHASASFFATLGVDAHRGRVFSRAEERPGAEAVALVTSSFSLARFGERVDPVGRTLVLDGVAHTVVGQLPPTADELAGLDADVWVPLRLEEPTRRGPFFLRVVARMAEGRTLDDARRDLAGISGELFPLWADSFQDREAVLTPTPLREALVGDVRRMLTVLQGAVALLLLIACVNVVNLVLTRASARRGEMGLRAALGAGRLRLARMLASEGLVMAGAGGVVGVALAAAGLAALRAAAPDLPRAQDVGLGWRALGLAGGLTCVAGALLGAVPALAVLGRTRAGGTVVGERRATGAGGRIRDALVAAEVALALPLLAAAALLVGSLLRLERVDPGYDPEGAAALRISLPEASYPDGRAAGVFWAEALRRVRALPAVASAGLSSGVPPDRAGTYNNFDLVDRPVGPGASQPVAPWNVVDPGFFEALGVPLLEGRRFGPEDAAGPPVVVVSRSWAERYYPGEEVLGRRLRAGGCASCTPITVVGVVGDVKFQGVSGAGDAVYSPISQEPWRTLHLVVRGRSGRAPVGPVREALRGLDPALALDDAAPLAGRLHASLSGTRGWSVLMAAFAAAAAALAAVGIFGVLSWAVARRTREIGVRLALGADRGAVLRSVVRRGMAVAGLGAFVGLGLALPVGRALEGHLFGVRAVDPGTLAAATVVLLGVALLACILPARRAAAVDPAVALASE